MLLAFRFKRSKYSYLKIDVKERERDPILAKDSSSPSKKKK